MNSKMRLCFFLLGLSSCQMQTGPIADVSGHYQGTLTTQADAVFSRTPVKADIQSLAQTGVISVTGANGAEAFSLRLTAISGDQVHVTPSLGFKGEVPLRLSEECYESSGDLKVTFCPSGPEVTFEIRDASGKSLLSLVLYRQSTDTTAPQESHRAYTLTEAVERARRLGFSSRIEFEHVVQAKATARAAYLNLLPHLTMGTVANVMTPSFSSILASIGDLAPFLLPNRWLAAGQSSDLSRSEQDADRLMHLDTGILIEGLTYAYQRDRVTLNLFQETLVNATQIRDEVKIREDLGQLPAGSTDNLDSIRNQIQQSVSTLNQLLIEDLGSLSQSMGDYDPSAVTDITLDQEEKPIENAPSYEIAQVTELAVQRSFELDQMDNLIEASQKAKDARYFSWLDPTGDPTMGLGAALPSQIEVSSSQIRELQIDREQLRSILARKALNAVTDYDEAVQAHRLAEQGVEIQERLLNQARIALEAGEKVDLFGLVQIFQNYLNARIQREAALASYRVARAQLDRLLLQGFYVGF